MTIPSSNISFIDIWEEANGTYSSGELSLFKMSNFSYFSGPNGSNTVSDNNWGRGEFSGADRIYNLTAQTSSFGVGDFSNLDYFYDNTNYKIILDVTNNVATPPPFPPPPPTANEFNPVILNFVAGWNAQGLREAPRDPCADRRGWMEFSVSHKLDRQITKHSRVDHA
jgi:hypothetical protein